MHYATLYQVRAYLKLRTDETADDTLLTRFIREAQQSIDEHCRRRFDVRQETRSFDYPTPKGSEVFGHYNAAERFVALMGSAADLSAGRLRLDDDLLSLINLVNGDGSMITSDYYVLEPANIYPKQAIRLVRGAGIAWQLGASGRREQVISVTGMWGYHPRYIDQAWIDSLDTVQSNPLSDSATSLTVSDADGMAGDGELVRFQAGNLIKIESEFLDVLAVDTATNILTVKRGANGTTAAQHAQGTTIYVFRPLENVVRACKYLVKLIYRQKDTDEMTSQQIVGTGIKITPESLPKNIRDILPPPRETGQGLL